MPHNAKQLAVQINKTLNDQGVTINSRERAQVLSKILGISIQQAWSLLEGHTWPDEEIIKKITSELEIDIPVRKE